MKNLSYIITISFISFIFGSGVQAQIVPQQNPIDTSIGGTGASKKALKRLNLPSDERNSLSNIEGPSKGWDRSRHDIQIHKITHDDLPGVKNYYLRSSTVLLERGGAAPVHSHFERPAFLQIVSGSVFQHRSDGTSFYMGPEDLTFASHELSHWWLNESKEETMRIWIVELCTAAHKCKNVVDGGAIKLKGSSNIEASNTHSKIIHQIDLKNEFKKAPNIENRRLRLRKITIRSGESFADQIGGSVGFLRIAQGKVSADGQDMKAGTFMYAPRSLSNHVFINIGNEDAVIYAVDITEETQ